MQPLEAILILGSKKIPIFVFWPIYATFCNNPLNVVITHLWQKYVMWQFIV